MTGISHSAVIAIIIAIDNALWPAIKYQCAVLQFGHTVNTLHDHKHFERDKLISVRKLKHGKIAELLKQVSLKCG